MPVLLTCAEARAIIEPLLPTQQKDLPSTLQLVLIGMVTADGGTVHDDPQVEAAANHIGNCPDCQAWLNLDGRYPERRVRRERIARYCCFSMFEAVTAEGQGLHVTCEYDRDGQRYWLVNSVQDIQFCPWCGTRLPQQPFEEESS